MFLSVIGEGLPLGYVNFQTLPGFLKKQAKGVQQPEGLLVSAEKMQELAPVGCRECGAVRSRPRPTFRSKFSFSRTILPRNCL